MRPDCEHLATDELLLAAARELPSEPLTRARAHLAECPLCAARLADAERAIETAANFHRDADTRLPAAAAARARLQQRLAEASAHARTTSPWHALMPAGAISRVGWTGALVLCAMLGLGSWYERTIGQPADDTFRVFLHPRSRLTPGAVHAVTAADLCHGRARPARPIPIAVQADVFRSYGADLRRVDDYELDHLITPELGGTQDPENLWPQPYLSTVWNAWVKDDLERWLHERVCAGEMDLRTAQLAIATDWIAAYKRYFETDAPLRNYLERPVTALDEDLLRAELDEHGLSSGRIEMDLADLTTSRMTARALGRFSNRPYGDPLMR